MAGVCITVGGKGINVNSLSISTAESENATRALGSGGKM